MLLAIGTCALVFYLTRAMIGRNITNHSLEKGKEKSSLFQCIWPQNDFLSHVLALEMDNFVKPKKICKLNKLKH